NLVRGVSVDSSHVYWAHANGGIGRADIDGQNPLINFMHLATGDAPGDVASDANHLYWTDPFFLNNWIGRSDLDGQNQGSFIAGTSGPLGLTMDSQYFYWSNRDNNTIGRATLDGSSVNHSFIASTGGLPLDVAVGSG